MTPPHPLSQAPNSPPPPTLNWRDLWITAPLETLLFALSVLSTHFASTYRELGLLGALVVFYACLSFWTLLALKLIRTLFPFQEGVFETLRDPWPIYRWRLHTFLAMNNLFLHYQNSLLPSPIRKFFSRLLGARVGRGIISIGGPVLDPYFITIEEGAMVGHEALLFPHKLERASLTLKRIRIEKGAVVGARAILHPGVTVGRNAMVKAMSEVPEGTVIPPYEIWGGIPARKMGQVPKAQEGQPARFMGWRDLVITPLVQSGILAIAGLSTYGAHRLWEFGFLTGALVFYAAVVLWTLVGLKMIRVLYPFREGIFSMAQEPRVCFIWSLYAFLGIVHLFFHYQMGLLPPLGRKLFARIMGAKIGSGLVSVAGILFDPFFITIEDDVVVGHDALLLPHAVAADSVVLKRIHVKRGAVISEKAMIMPGVTIGEHARVEPQSLVTMDTVIGPREIWRGIPARKVGAVPPDPASGSILQGFLNWRDWTLTPLVELALFAFSGWVVYRVNLDYSLDFGSMLLVFALGLVAATVFFCALLRRVFPFASGVHRDAERPWVVYRWRLHAFLCLTNLFLLYQNCLLPPGFRMFFGRLLGGRLSRGIMTIGGFIADPFFVRLGDGARVGVDSMIAPCHYSMGKLVLKPIEIEENAVIDPRVVVKPGVRIGAGSTVRPFSVVMEDTVVPPGETWAGNPVQRLYPQSG